jgi:hypothetical protein
VGVSHQLSFEVNDVTIERGFAVRNDVFVAGVGMFPFTQVDG